MNNAFSISVCLRVMAAVIPLAAFSAPASAPVVTLLSATRDDAGARPVRIEYSLSGAEAVVLLDVLTNGVSIGGANVRRVCGDVGRMIGPGDARRSIAWFPDRDFPDRLIDEGAVSFRLSAHPRGREPDYMEIDLCVPSNVVWYAGEDFLPFGIDSDVYRSDRLLMRRIAAAGVTWPMGTPTNSASDGNNARVYDFPQERQHEVTLTNDFYIGVFELTQAQWRSVKNEYPQKSGYTKSDRAFHPAENVSYNDVRGEGAYWPAAPTADSFLGRLRSFTGLDLDLPGEAQWEFAARAGNYGGRTGSGLLQTVSNATAIMQSSCSPSPSGTSAAVGSYLPNDWGLYDTLGNVWEWCLDAAVTNVTANAHGEIALFAEGDMPAPGYMIVRGGCWYTHPYDCRAAKRATAVPTRADGGSRGLRVCLTLPNGSDE